LRLPFSQSASIPTVLLTQCRPFFSDLSEGSSLLRQEHGNIAFLFYIFLTFLGRFFSDPLYPAQLRRGRFYPPPPLPTFCSAWVLLGKIACRFRLMLPFSAFFPVLKNGPLRLPIQGIMKFFFLFFFLLKIMAAGTVPCFAEPFFILPSVRPE